MILQAREPRARGEVINSGPRAGELEFSEEAGNLLISGQGHKLESRLLGEISITSDMQMTPPLWQKV